MANRLGLIGALLAAHQVATLSDLIGALLTVVALVAGLVATLSGLIGVSLRATVVVVAAG